MSRLLITNSRIWQEDRFLDGRCLLIEGGGIRAIARAGEITPEPGDRRLDARGCYALPGFVDLHLHGSDGCDVMDARPGLLGNLGAFLLRQGVTTCLGTTMADSRARISRALDTLREHINAQRSPFVGAHLEGPYLNADYRGSQPAQHLRSPEPAEYRPWLDSGVIKLITLAPELAGGADLLAEAVARGIHVSIGHSAADYAAAGDFFRAGISQITHTFNGMPGLHHRAPGILTAAIENPQVTFQIIADGVHVHPAVLRLLLRLAGRERVLAITDAMRATGLADGIYGLGDVTVTTLGGVARAAHGGLAGSTLTMPGALRNLMRFCSQTLEQALPILTRVPARSVGLYPRKGSLRVGADADIVLWDEAAGVQTTVLGGEVVHQTL